MAKVPGAVTDPSRIKAEATTYKSGGETLNGYIARPVAPGSYPGLIVIHEAFGLVEHIRDLCRRFANIGYIAFAPDLYSRVGTPDHGNMDQVLKVMFGMKDADVLKDLEAAADHLRGPAGANAKVGVIGFCSGGRQTMLLACGSRKVDAAADCWGGFTLRAGPDAVTTPNRPKPIADMIEQLACPLLVVIGAEDKNPSPADGKEIEARLKKYGKNGKVSIYEGVGHAFLADYRPTWNEAASFKLWPELTGFFEKHLRS